MPAIPCCLIRLSGVPYKRRSSSYDEAHGHGTTRLDGKHLQAAMPFFFTVERVVSKGIGRTLAHRCTVNGTVCHNMKCNGESAEVRGQWTTLLNAMHSLFRLW